MLFTNKKCINCAACSYFAPNTFKRSSKSNHHIVYQQPQPPSTFTNTCNDISTSLDFRNARAALAACPVSAIRTLTKGEINHHNNAIVQKQRLNCVTTTNGGDDDNNKVLTLLPPLTKEEEVTTKLYAINNDPLPFPRSLSNNNNHDNATNSDIGVWLLGHHSSKSFGAFPYLVKGYHQKKKVSIMVDVPKFTKSAIRTVTSLTSSSCSGQEQEQKQEQEQQHYQEQEEPDFMFLTHVDDTAQHNEWKNEFPSMKRIFHSGDLGIHNWLGDETLEDVEVLLDGQSQLHTTRKSSSSRSKQTNDQQDSNSQISGDLVVFSLDGERRTIQLPGSLCSSHISDGGKKPNESLFESAILDTMNEFDSDFLILHTPGHSPGSISLLYNKNRRSTKKNNSGRSSSNSCSTGEVQEGSGTLFTGDTYAYTTRDGGHMSGFPRYGNDLKVQAATLECISALSGLYDCIASGHGHIRDYNRILPGKGGDDDVDCVLRELKLSDSKDAIHELERYF